jgi:hypothetical protein
VSDQKLSELATADPLVGTELVYLVQDGASVQATAQDIADLAPPGGGGTPGGSDTQVQFNDDGAFGGDEGLTFNKTTKVLTINGGVISVASGKTLTSSNTLTLAGTDSTTMTFPAVTASIGYLNIPQSGGAAKTTNYTGVLGDQGQLVVMDGSSLTFTIPANGSVAYAVGTVLTIVNANASALSIAITTDTMTLAGTTTTGTRTLAQNGIATAIKITSTSWLINGIGLY